MRPVSLATLAAAIASVAASPITCTKSKNNGGILLYGNFDWDGGWLEVYNTGGDGATFNLMFEMDCDGGGSRRFDFAMDGDHSFSNATIPYQHYLSGAIDHSIFSMDPIGPVSEGVYE